MKVKGYIKVPADELEIILRHLPRHIELTRKESGCIAFEVVQRTDNLLVFDVEEEFVDREAWQLHQQRIKNSEWGRVSNSLERHYRFEDTET